MELADYIEKLEVTGILKKDDGRDGNTVGTCACRQRTAGSILRR